MYIIHKRNSDTDKNNNEDNNENNYNNRFYSDLEIFPLKSLI